MNPIANSTLNSIAEVLPKSETVSVVGLIVFGVIALADLATQHDYSMELNYGQASVKIAKN